MIRFQTILWACYIIFAFVSYPYLRKSYFPREIMFIEKIMIGILASVWLVTAPITFMLREDNDGEEL